MKSIVVFVFATIALLSNVRADAPEWQQVPEILARIVPPKFPARDFDITKYGAVADGKTDSSEAITKPDRLVEAEVKMVDCVLEPAKK